MDEKQSELLVCIGRLVLMMSYQFGSDNFPVYGRDDPYARFTEWQHKLLYMIEEIDDSIDLSET